jgi:hypothetical protein
MVNSIMAIIIDTYFKQDALSRTNLNPIHDLTRYRVSTLTLSSIGPSNTKLHLGAASAVFADFVFSNTRIML